MRTRIGYGGPQKYRHGQYFPGGRRNNGGMTEIERLIHLIASMQVLFGSRRGGLLVPILLVAALVGGWFAYQSFYSPDRALEKAHLMWESNDSKQRMKAIDQYKVLLQKKDRIEPGRNWLVDDRDTLYRRIIHHEVKYTLNENRASEWCLKAWNEGIHDLNFQDEEVKAVWDKTIASMKRKQENHDKNVNPTPAEQNGFKSLPGLEPLGLI